MLPLVHITITLLLIIITTGHIIEHTLRPYIGIIINLVDRFAEPIAITTITLEHIVLAKFVTKIIDRQRYR